MNVNQLRIFKNVVEKGNFSNAARFMNITTVAVSKQMRALELELNLPIFKTINRKKVLTDLGQVIYQKALMVISQIDSIKDFSVNIENEPAGQLKIVCHSGVSESILIPLLKDFMNKYPKISVDISLKNYFKSYYSKKYDILFGVTDETAKEYYENCLFKKIYTGKLILTAAKLYLAKYGTPVKVNDLSVHRYLNLKTRKFDRVLHSTQNLKIQFNTSISFNDTAALCYATLNGLGIAQIPDLLFKKIAASYNDSLIELVTLSSLLAEQTYNLNMVYQKAEFVAPKIIAFKDYINERIQHNRTFSNHQQSMLV